MNEWPIPPFIGHDGEVVALLDTLELDELILAAIAFDDLTDWRMPESAIGWARWWCWKIHRRLGDRPDARQPVDAIPASDMHSGTRRALGEAFMMIADGQQQERPRLAAFFSRLAAQLAAIDLDQDLDAAALRAHLAEMRRPPGSPADVSRLPSWRDVSGPPGSAAEENPWA